MFTLPSIWNIVISTIVFVIAAWYFHKWLNERGLPKGITRSLLVFVLAYAVSWVSGEVVDWSRLKIYGVEPASPFQQPLNDLLTAAGYTP